MTISLARTPQVRDEMTFLRCGRGYAKAMRFFLRGARRNPSFPSQVHRAQAGQTPPCRPMLAVEGRDKSDIGVEKSVEGGHGTLYT